jgi:hypothetical protein
MLGCDDDLPPKITFGELRESGVRDVLIYCRDHRCSHHVETNAGGWGDLSGEIVADLARLREFL